MQKVIGLIFALSSLGFGAISSLTIPHEIDSAAIPKVIYIDQNNDSIVNKVNEIKDTVNLYVPGGGVYTGSVLSSTGSLRLTVDSDNNGTGNCVAVTHNGSTDTIAKFCDDLTIRLYGAGTGTKLTLSDSILAATARISGLTASRLMATNAGSTLASVTDLTAWVAGTANQITATSDGDGSLTLSIPNGFTLPSASPTFTGLTLSGLAGTGTRLTTSTSTGVQGNATTISGTYAWSGNHSITGTLGIVASSSSLPSSDGNPLLFATAEGGSDPFNLNGHLVLQGRSGGGSGRDIIFYTGTTPTMRYRLTTGGTHTFSSDVVLSSMLSVTGVQTNAQDLVFSASRAIRRDVQTGSIDFSGGNSASDGANITLFGSTHATLANNWRIRHGTANTIAYDGTSLSIGNATTNPAINLLGSGTKTIDGTINTDLTASRTVVTDGSGNLSVNTETGTGSHVKATSPTLVTPTLGVASATSIALGGGEAFVYGDTSFTVTGTGFSGSVTATAYGVKIGRLVTIHIVGLSGTSNATSFTITGIPSGWQPANISTHLVLAQDGSVETIAVAQISGGTITLSKGVPSGAWGSIGTKGIFDTPLTYQLQ